MPAHEEHRPRAARKRHAAHLGGAAEQRVGHVVVTQLLVRRRVAHQHLRRDRAGGADLGRVEDAHARPVAGARDDRDAALARERRPAEQRPPFVRHHTHVAAHEGRRVVAHPVWPRGAPDRRSREMALAGRVVAVVERIGRDDQTPTPRQDAAEQLGIAVGRIDVGEIRHARARLEHPRNAAQRGNFHACHGCAVEAAVVERGAIGAQPRGVAAVGEQRAAGVGVRQGELAEIGEVACLNEVLLFRGGLRRSGRVSENPQGGNYEGGGDSHRSVLLHIWAAGVGTLRPGAPS